MTDEFLLTRPLRDVTIVFYTLNVTDQFLLTRPLRDVTAIITGACSAASISTHTPLTGRDGCLVYRLRGPWDFYSHAPYGT